MGIMCSSLLIAPYYSVFTLKPAARLPVEGLIEVLDFPDMRRDLRPNRKPVADVISAVRSCLCPEVSKPAVDEGCCNFCFGLANICLHSAWFQSVCAHRGSKATDSARLKTVRHAIYIFPERPAETGTAYSGL